MERFYEESTYKPEFNNKYFYVPATVEHTVGYYFFHATWQLDLQEQLRFLLIAYTPVEPESVLGKV
jgi:hypothetical protein